MNNKLGLRSSTGFCVLFLLVACSSTTQAIPIATSTIVPPTATPKPIGFAPARTPPASTIRPTIDPDFEKEYYLKLLRGETHPCQLPCLWDIEPGKSGWEEIDTIFGPVSYGPNIPHKYGAEEVLTKIFVVNEQSMATLLVDFAGSEEIVKYIRVQASPHPPDHPSHDEDLDAILRQYSVKIILSEFGTPSKVSLDIPAGGGGPFTESGGGPFYILRLHYYDIGVLFEYEFGDGISIDHDNQTITACPEHSNMIWFTLVASSPDNPSVLVGRLGNFKELEDISNLSIEEFTELFAASTDSVCFETFVQ